MCSNKAYGFEEMAKIVFSNKAMRLVKEGKT
jgi:hypothetical protein